MLTENEEEVIAEATIYDSEEEIKVANFLGTGCGCTLYFGGPFNKAFSADHFQDLDHTSLDLVLLGQIMGTNSHSSTVQSSHQKSSIRKKTRMSYYHHGIPVCRTTFLSMKMMDLPQGHMGIVIVDHTMALQPTS